MIRVLEIDLIPSHPVAVHASRQRETEVPHRKAFDDSGRPQMKFRDHPVVVLPLGAEFLDTTDEGAVRRMDLFAEEQLDAAFISFRHDDLRESWQ